MLARKLESMLWVIQLNSAAANVAACEVVFSCDWALTTYGAISLTDPRRPNTGRADTDTDRRRAGADVHRL